MAGVRASQYCQSTLAATSLLVLSVDSLGDEYEFTLFLQMLLSLLQGSNPTAGHWSGSS